MDLLYKAYGLYLSNFSLLIKRIPLQELALDSSELPSCLQQLRKITEFKTVCEGVADGILFWYDASFHSYRYSSLLEETNARCGMFLFDKSRELPAGESLVFKTSLYHGNVIIEEVV